MKHSLPLFLFLPLAACSSARGAGGVDATGSGGATTAGSAGASGGAGTSGTAGKTGTAGANGAAGVSGVAGMSGAAGMRGPNVTYACGRELHVATTGSDTNDGMAATPLRTIAKATPLAQAGDCILVHAGTYAETATIGFVHDGTATAPIVLRSADGHLAAIIDAKNDRPGPTVLVRNDYVIIDGFEFLNSPMDTEEQAIHFDGLTEGKGKGSVLRNCKATGGYDTLKLNQASEGITVEYNELYGTFAHLPVSLTGANGLTFRGNYCHDWTLNGFGAIQLKGGTHDVLFEGNHFQDIHTDAGAIALGDSCDSTCDIDPEHYAAVRVRATNNVMVRVGRGFDVQGCKDCAILSNTILDSGQGNVIFKLTSAATNGVTRATVNARIIDNLISNAKGDGGNVIQINTPADMGLQMDYNLVWNAGTAISWGDGHPATADTHSITKDPKMTSAGSFTLGAGSPGRSAGINLFADVPDDFTGAARPATGMFDIGALQAP
jgi:hypothetical protein